MIRRPFLKVFLGAAAAVTLGCIVLALSTDAPGEAAIGVLVVMASLLPAGLWAARIVPGIPIFPLYAVTFLWAFALPVIRHEGSIAAYPPAAQRSAAILVAGFLTLGTAAWATCARRPTTAPRPWLQEPPRLVGAKVLLGLAAMNAVLHVSVSSGALAISGGVFSVLRGLLLGTASVAAFVLAYLWGRRELPRPMVIATAVVMGGNLVANMTGLLLVGALSLGLLLALGHVLGRGRVRVGPWLMLGAVLVVLHYGKGTMRERYWAAGAGRLEVTAYPAFFGEWIRASWDRLATADEPPPQSFVTRAGLMQLFLRAREAHENGLPHLHGATYAIIPILLVPRVVSPDKPFSHEGTFLLNIHYGLQRREDTFRTTIGWGLFNEAYANFGIGGLAALALLIGATAGAVGRWTIAADPLSGRFLFAVLVLSTSFQSEFSAGVLVTSLAQSSAGLLVYVAVRRIMILRGRRTAASDHRRHGAYGGPGNARASA